MLQKLVTDLSPLQTKIFHVGNVLSPDRFMSYLIILHVCNQTPSAEETKRLQSHFKIKQFQTQAYIII